MKRLVVLMLTTSLWLTSCGQLEVQVERTAVPTPSAAPTQPVATPPPTPSPATPTESAPVLTPPNSLIAFETSLEQPFSDIAVVRADGSEYAQLTTYGYNSDPVLSPDGRFIAYRSIPASITSLPDPGSRLYEGHYNIWVITVDGTQAWKLTDNEAQRSVPAWSPGSDRVLFSEGETGAIVDIEVATQTRREWLAQGGFAPRYKPDANGIGYITADGNLMWQASDGTAHLVVDAHTLSPTLRVNDFSWMPDGVSVVFTLADDVDRIDTSTIGIKYTLWLLPLGGSATQLAEDVHHAQPSPAGQSLAVQIGSGYGDACGVDLRQGFLDLTTTPPTLVVSDDFTGRPAGVSFYPTSSLLWLSERFAAASFGVTCAPNASAFGPYWLDISERQLQQIAFQRSP